MVELVKVWTLDKRYWTEEKYFWAPGSGLHVVITPFCGYWGKIRMYVL